MRRIFGPVRLGVKTHVLASKTQPIVFGLMSCVMCPATCVLGVLLHYLNSTMRIKTLSQIFGASPAIVSRCINNTMTVLCDVLRELPCGVIQWPSHDQMKIFASMIHDREPRLTNVFGFMDGVWFPMFNPSNPLTQNAYFNGWKQCTNVSNVVSIMHHSFVM